MTIGGTIHIAMVCGYMTFLFPGFAKADAVEQLAQQQVAMITQQLDTEIFRTREMQCRSSSSDAKMLYTQRLQDKLQQFQKMARYQYRLPGCDEYGQTAGAGTP